MFITISHFNPCLIFDGMARRSLPFEGSSIRGSTLVSLSRACKVLIRVEVANTLAYYGAALITAVIFYMTGPAEKKLSIE